MKGYNYISLLKICWEFLTKNKNVGSCNRGMVQLKKEEYLKENKSKLEKIFKSEPQKYEYIIKLINYEADNKKNKRV
ncbi:Uncharacterised protein [Clostridioides difficile]|nr:conserved hypothetical protein [Clostridioides difficile T22]SJO73480.1 Uncharacterised protein [Clostridioides difficile]SJP67023.1 Uncharacterised protein [Clostridioides difficile]SJT05966.1 Uncharacterised protein [Clostridioides difficile]SJV84782.1 Uncharacterised protein [Clostridioides difficile]